MNNYTEKIFFLVNFFFFSFSQWSEITDFDNVEKILNETEMTPNKIRFNNKVLKLANLQSVKSRIELNKRLHYTPLVSLMVLLLLRSTLSYRQIKSLLS